jgi:hypothetical protein
MVFVASLRYCRDESLDSDGHEGKGQYTSHLLMIAIGSSNMSGNEHNKSLLSSPLDATVDGQLLCRLSSSGAQVSNPSCLEL